MNHGRHFNYLSCMYIISKAQGTRFSGGDMVGSDRWQEVVMEQVRRRFLGHLYQEYWLRIGDRLPSGEKDPYKIIEATAFRGTFEVQPAKHNRYGCCIKRHEETHLPLIP
jgi:hypothetical protein